MTIELIRYRLRKSKFIFQLTDLGAGSKYYAHNVGLDKVVKRSSSAGLKILFFVGLAKCKNKKTLLELGTNLGFTTFYFATICPNLHIITIEGDATLYKFAKRLAKLLSLKNITFVNADFDLILPEILKNHQPDLIIIDGNHRYSPTLRYFDLINSTVQGKTSIILDDIRWSKQMYKAWQKINSPRIVKKFDFYKFGLIVLKPQIFNHEQQSPTTTQG